MWRSLDNGKEGLDVPYRTVLLGLDPLIMRVGCFVGWYYTITRVAEGQWCNIVSVDGTVPLQSVESGVGSSRFGCVQLVCGLCSRSWDGNCWGQWSRWDCLAAGLRLWMLMGEWAAQWRQPGLGATLLLGILGVGPVGVGFVLSSAVLLSMGYGCCGQWVMCPRVQADVARVQAVFLQDSFCCYSWLAGGALVRQVWCFWCQYPNIYQCSSGRGSLWWSRVSSEVVAECWQKCWCQAWGSRVGMWRGCGIFSTLVIQGAARGGFWRCECSVRRSWGLVSPDTCGQF